MRTLQISFMHNVHRLANNYFTNKTKPASKKQRRMYLDATLASVMNDGFKDISNKKPTTSPTTLELDA